MGDYVKFEYQAEFNTSIYAHCACCVEISHFVNVAKGTCASVLCLVQFNNFVLTTGFYWGYTLLLKSPVPMCS